MRKLFVTCADSKTAISPIAFYQIGYGVAAFGVGPLQQKAGLNLNTIFGATVIVALAVSALSFIIGARDI